MLVDARITQLDARLQDIGVDCVRLGPSRDTWTPVGWNLVAIKDEGQHFASLCVQSELGGNDQAKLFDLQKMQQQGEFSLKYSVQEPEERSVR